ncbi:fatty acid synthase-like isoform X3 [Zootermopsis nevadensis]|nr:fatty acid synthase-like isoform X3 [Zootermopsis nevadensis]
MSHSSNTGIQMSQTPAAGEEIVISGIAGCFPESENVYQFRDNLFNKVDMITDDDRRWRLDHPEIPARTGKLYNLNRFDASFFGIHYKQVQTMDPQGRMLLEKTYEAIVDAGVNPRLLKGQNTGVFVGSSFSESEKCMFYEKFHASGIGLIGCSRAMLANRISYWLGVHGPSYMLDSACSSSLYAIEHAYKAIQDGQCDSAIVGSCNLCLHPYISLMFTRLGVLSPDGSSKVFDRDANGCVRSEAICVMFLQKARDAKRVYATVVHAKTNSDGFKDRGITYPSRDMKKKLMEEFYEECGVSPTSLDFIEAHGTGTKVGDFEELNVVDEVFCKGRQTPLLIGSVKSNMGHADPVSGLCSVTKVIIAMENEIIPPNLNYSNPRQDVEGLIAGRLKVVTENLPWNGGLVGVNSFGFGGANAHVLLQWHEKKKVDGGAPTDSIPRLIVVSGRTEEAVDIILTNFESQPVDAEFVSLMHDLQSLEIAGHTYRGYSLLTHNERTVRSIKFYPGSKRPVWFVFTGMGSQWPGMGKSLLKLPVFAAAIEKCQRALKPCGVDVLNIITSDDQGIFDNILNCFVGIAACQIGLVDIMRSVGIEADGIVGHSVGELGCAYMDGCFTAEQMVLAAYFRGLASLETELINGLMAAVGLGAEEAKKLCPPDIEVACHNGSSFCTLSGPAESMKKFVKTLQQQGVFAKEVNCANIAYHSRYISSAGPLLLKYLKQLIPHPKPRSSRWVSSSVPENEWNSPSATHSSAEYHTNNLLSAVLFEEASRHIPHNAITIEIAPHGLLQAILKRSLNKGITNIAITRRGHPDCTEVLLTALGKLFELGLQPQLAKLYPSVEYPVSRGTPMISPLVRWEHSQDWFVMKYMVQEKVKSSGERSVSITLDDMDMKYLSGHVIDGRNLFPAMGYLELVWESIGIMNSQVHTELPVVFEDVQFHRVTNIPKEGSIEFAIMVQKGSGKFEVSEKGTAIVSGTVRIPENISHEMASLESYEPNSINSWLELSSDDIYKELQLRGYNYQGIFRSLVSLDNFGQKGKISWSNNWVAFMDSMLQVHLLQDESRSLLVPTSIQKLTIDVKRHPAFLHALGDASEKLVAPVCMYEKMGIIRSGGVEVRGLKESAITRRRNAGRAVLEKCVFTPNVEPVRLDLHSALRVCTHIALENKPGAHVKVVELHNEGTALLSPAVAAIIADLPLIKAKITVLAKASDRLEADLNKTGIKVKEHELENEQNCTLVIASNILPHGQLLQTTVSALADGACILTREKLETKTTFTNGVRLEVVFEKTLKDEKLLLLRKGVVVENPIVIHVTTHNYDWLPQVQTAIGSNSKRHIILVAQGEPLSGIVGLVNCIRKEPGCDFVRCYFIPDTSAPPFDLNLPFYRQQLRKDLAVNVYIDGKWGSYRHLPLDSCATVTVPHAYVNIMRRGDLSSFRWLEGNLDPDSIQTERIEELVHIYYSGVNFKDVMTATERVTSKAPKGQLDLDNVQGFEFSGRDQKGSRVMGMVPHGALASMLLVDKDLLWDVPKHWTLEDAATVPLAYGTAYYALVIVGNLKKGESVLIHSGSGGVGQAAINICLHTGCTVYTTVGTQEKRDFIKKQFPQLTDHNIGNSEDSSFEQLVRLETFGRGVDLVLNSLAEEKLQASVRCLAPRGRFLEIGKFDLENNNLLGMEVFLKETSFHGVMLDELFTASSEFKKKLCDIMTEGIASGAVRPLPRIVFPTTEVEQALRYVAAGKHIGKVLVHVRPKEDKRVFVPVPWLMQAYPRYFCNPSYAYIITGGLEDIGLELADWLVSRGARKLVLTSRDGIKTGYQSLRVRIWRSYGATVVISPADITTKSGVRALLSHANKLGQVDAIFNLAVVLRDKLLENQTEADFAASAGPKALATHHLDALSRQMCPHLRHFVVFSSVSCGRGNAGQMIYGMNNSVVERVCEARVRDGLPGLAVQWGGVGDVGLVAEMQKEQQVIQTGGTPAQKISSYLEMLDVFLRQPCPVVASTAVADKSAGTGGSGDVVSCIASIIGIPDVKTICLNSTLAELGLDTMTAVAIKQTLEQEFELYLTPQEIRNLTFSHLEELSASKQQNGEEQHPLEAASRDDEDLEGQHLLLRLIGDEPSASLPVVRLPSATGIGTDVEDEVKAGPVLFMLPGVEGVPNILKPLAKNLKYQTICLQLDYSDLGHTIDHMAETLLPHIQSRLAPRAPFTLLGYSFGGLLALELALKLEAEGREGKLYLLDSSPDFMKVLLEQSVCSSEDQFEISVLCSAFNLIAPCETSSAALSKLVQELTPLKSLDEKLDYFFTKLPVLKNSAQNYRAVGVSFLSCFKAMSSYEWDPRKTVKSHVTLLRSSTFTLKTEEDYGLSKCCEKKVEVHSVTGNHLTMLESYDAAVIINRQVTHSEALKFKNSLSEQNTLC